MPSGHMSARPPSEPYTGKTYNSVENISQFFAERGMPVPSGLQRPAAAAGSSLRRRQAPQQPGRDRRSSRESEEESFRRRLDGAASEVWAGNRASPGRRRRRREADSQFPGLRAEEDYREIRRIREE